MGNYNNHPKPVSYTPPNQARTSYTTHRQSEKVVKNDDFFLYFQ